MTPTPTSVEEFCRRHRLSVQIFYKYPELMPDSFYVGSRRLISREAATRWRAEREAATAAAFEFDLGAGQTKGDPIESRLSINPKSLACHGTSLPIICGSRAREHQIRARRGGLPAKTPRDRRGLTPAPVRDSTGISKAGDQCND